jgi:FkbM family methyltransferase
MMADYLGLAEAHFMALKATVRRFLYSNKTLLKRLLPTGRPVVIRIKGFKLYIYLDDWAVGARIALRRSYEPHVTRAIEHALKPGGVFLDIGANIGYYTLLAAARVGPQGNVIAFEPNPHNCELLSKSVELNRFANVTLHAYAVSDQAGSFGFSADDSNGRLIAGDQEIAQFQVETVVLDQFLAQEARIDLIKMDIEGFEGKALQGMKELIRRHTPVIISEFNAGSMERLSGIKPAEYLDQLRELGYTIAIIADEPIPAFDNAVVFEYVRQTSHSDHIDILAIPRSQAV